MRDNKTKKIVPCEYSSTHLADDPSALVGVQTVPTIHMSVLL